MINFYSLVTLTLFFSEEMGIKIVMINIRKFILQCFRVVKLPLGE